MKKFCKLLNKAKKKSFFIISRNFIYFRRKIHLNRRICGIFQKQFEKKDIFKEKNRCISHFRPSKETTNIFMNKQHYPMRYFDDHFRH